MGAAVVADAKGAAKTLFVQDPNLKPLFGPLQDAFTTQVTAAGGAVATLTISSASVGNQVPTQVVSYLQAHPNVKYVAFPTDDYLAGVPQALSTAGVSGVKLLGTAPQAANLAAIKAGTEWLSIADEDAAAGYRAIDTLARILEHMPFDTAPAGWHQIMTKDDVTQTSGEQPTPGSPQSFFAAWHVDG